MALLSRLGAACVLSCFALALALALLAATAALAVGAARGAPPLADVAVSLPLLFVYASAAAAVASVPLPAARGPGPAAGAAAAAAAEVALVLELELPPLAPLGPPSELGAAEEAWASSAAALAALLSRAQPVAVRVDVSFDGEAAAAPGCAATLAARAELPPAPARLLHLPLWAAGRAASLLRRWRTAQPLPRERLALGGCRVPAGARRASVRLSLPRGPPGGAPPAQLELAHGSLLLLPGRGTAGEGTDEGQGAAEGAFNTKSLTRRVALTVFAVGTAAAAASLFLCICCASWVSVALWRAKARLA